jgi:ELWxxDGT repeat protein
MLADLNAGSGDSAPYEFTPLNAYVLFATNFTNNHGLWRTDLTAAGTAQLINPSGVVGDIAVAGAGRAFFRVGGNGNEQIWKTDATLAGTVAVGASHSLDLSASEDSFVGDGDGNLCFTAFDTTHGAELWKSDGTHHRLRRRHKPGPLNSFAAEFTAFDGKVYFSADDGIHGRELWVTNGTTAGTMLFKDINPGADDSHPGSFTVLNGKLVFAAHEPSNGIAIWSSNGTSAGTAVAVDLNARSDPSNPQFIGRSSNGSVFFAADDPDTGFLQLWRTDGTEAGTVLLYRPANFADVRFAAVLGDKLYFAGTDATHGTELWSSDGTVTGTGLFGDINPGTGSSVPQNLTAANGLLYFTANNGANGSEPWRTDGRRWSGWAI